MKAILISVCLGFTALWAMPAFSQEVKVFNKVPVTCKTGDKCIITVVIEKQGVEGFARIQQTLPEGFTAELITDAGSDFIFDKQKISFIWLSLPATPTIEVAYRIIPASNLAGMFDIGDGTFSYLRENKIQKLAIAPQPLALNVAPPPVVAAADKAPSSEQIPSIQPKPEGVKELPTVSEEPPKAIPPVEEPPLPKTPVVQEELQTKEPDPPANTLSEPKIKEATPVVKPAPEPTPQPKIVEQPQPATPEPPTVNQPKKPDPPARSINPEATINQPGVQYRVQFAALKTAKDVDVLKKQFGIPEQVFLETADGWNRYTFGPWSAWGDAESARKAFVAKHGGTAIIIKYQDGKRVPLN
jgi:outer membrane biosynthesis protein TonB